MRQVVCNYAPVRFLPYREVGEFVTVGVVLHCPQTDFFGYRLVPPRRTGRVTGFFPELDANVFKAALQGTARELARVQAYHSVSPGDEVPTVVAQAQMQRFRELIRRREGVLHFGDPGTLMGETPQAALAELFSRFVDRQFAQKREYQETVMRNRLIGFLRQWNLSHHYIVNQTVGDDDFHVVMPFVHYEGEVVDKVIKPLDLDKAESSDVYHHGGAWVKNMERLKGRDRMPRAVVFAVQLPKIGKPLAAAKTICDELERLGVNPVEFNNTQKIRSAVEVSVAA